MKTYMNKISCVKFLSKYLSNRAASYVSCVILNIPFDRSAREHLERNGGCPSLAANKIILRIQEVGLFRFEIAVLHNSETGCEENSHNPNFPEWEENIEHILMAYDPCYAVRIVSLGEKWWEEEGKFECELEERGETKYYFYENECRERWGRGPLTPKQFLTIN